jgi:hypothetical protein
MPKVNYNVAKKPQKKVKELTCSGCGELKKDTDFYASYNPIHATGRLPYCKACLIRMSTDSNGSVLMDKLYETLKLVDRPFIYDLWNTSITENPTNTIGSYFKNLSLSQNRNFTWKNSAFQEDDKPIQNTGNVNKFSDFILTDELTDKWGAGYTNEEYFYFEKKWYKLIDNYGEKTALHTEGLITYIRFRVKEELATARGDVRESKEWGNMASSAAKDAKLNVAQLSKSDLNGGVDLLPQLFEAVESDTGIIPILPKLKEQPYDDADLIIWCIINYLRRLEDKPRVSYKEIWHFYDEMLVEHFKQKGYTKEMVEKERLKRNAVFRDLEQVYKEPIYEESET